MKKLVFSSLTSGILLLTIGLIHDPYKTNYQQSSDTNSINGRRPSQAAICGTVNNQISLSTTQTSLLIIALLTSAYSIILVTSQFLKKSTKTRNITRTRRST